RDEDGQTGTTAVRPGGEPTSVPPPRPPDRLRHAGRTKSSRTALARRAPGLLASRLRSLLSTGLCTGCGQPCGWEAAQGYARERGIRATDDATAGRLRRGLAGDGR